MTIKKQNEDFQYNENRVIDTSYQRLFLFEQIMNNDKTLNNTSQNDISHEIRCEKCGFPIKTEKEKIVEFECFICKRINKFGTILVCSYILSALIFAASIILVIFEILSFDISLMIGCLEIIFLLFFGRFLEEAVYFGLAKNERIIAAIYRFAESGEIQAYDIALRFLENISQKEIPKELYSGIFHVLIYQPLDTPYYFYSQISNHLDITIPKLIQNLKLNLSQNENEQYLEELLNKAKPAGVSNYLKLTKNSGEIINSLIIIKRIKTVIEEEKIDDNWAKDFFINKSLYEEFLIKNNEEETVAKIDNILSQYNIPKVPSIDVVESSKKIMRNPLVRYILRIFMYIALALILSLIYQFLNNL